MNPPSLRELCAKATPGPWRINPDAAFPGVWSGSLADEKELVASPLGDSPTVQANAQLIARFSPETALAVYEALEPVAIEARALLEAIIYPGPQTFEQVEPERDSSRYGIMLTLKQLKALRHALRLLDGRTEP